MAKVQIRNQVKWYEFEDREIVGKEGERILDSWISSIYKSLDVSKIRKYQEAGIDRILTRPDGTTVTVEYKFDLASLRTGNLFFETVSVDKRNVPGWGWKSRADYWIFLLPSMEVLVVEPGRLRNLIWRNRLRFESKEVQNFGYKTLGVPVPLLKVREIAHHITKLKRST